MKKILWVSILLSPTLWAQIPSGYYNTATGSGYTLKTQLRNIIASGYVIKSYDALYGAYVTTDTDLFYENDNSVLDMYSENPSGTDPYNYQHYFRQCGSYNSENDCYNREHVFPQGFFNSNSPMVSDAHHVTPTDGYVNNRRANFPFGKVNTPTWTSLNGSKVGPSSTPGYTGTVFEPIDEFKGDIARILLYFAVRYENEVLGGGWDAHNSAPENPLNGTKDQFYEDWYIKLLLSWHNQDPVSAREISRNNAVYNYQNNRNPFIDNPSYATQIWGHLVDSEPPTAPTNLTSSNITANGLSLNWTAATDNVGVTGYDVFKDNVFLATTTNTTYSVSGLNPSTTYNFKVRAKDAEANLSTFSNEINVTTLAGSGGGGSSTELFISEYVEGSVNNRAIEIANFTGNYVNLSNYTIKKQVNGEGSWVNELLLSGTLNHAAVYVIANSSASTAITSVAQITVSGAPIDFNGNDPIGLFKNGTLIDIVGVLNVITNFAADVTLRRKSNVINPTTTYNINEWESFPVDTFSGLGNHTTLSSDDYLNSKFTVYPNPTKNQTIFISVDHSVTVKNIEVTQMSGKRILFIQQPQIEHNTIKLSQLPFGFYIVKMETDQGVAHKKIIIN